MGGGDGESPCKRGSVLAEASDDHPSMRPTRRFPCGRRATHLLLGLASKGVYQAVQITSHAGALLPHRFTLTCDAVASIGGLFSVALSVRSPQPDSRQLSAL